MEPRSQRFGRLPLPDDPGKRWVLAMLIRAADAALTARGSGPLGIRSRTPTRLPGSSGSGGSGMIEAGNVTRMVR